MTDPQPIPFIPRSKEDALAQEIAQAFNDETRLSWYRRVCYAHDYSLVYRAYTTALRTPVWRIRRSRRALFIYLIHRYETRE